MLRMVLETVGGGMGKRRCKKWPPPSFAYTEGKCVQITWNTIRQVEHWVGTSQIKVWR